MDRYALAVLAVLPLACADASEAALFELREGPEPAQLGGPVIPLGEEIREVTPPDELEDDEEDLDGDAPQIVVGPWLGARADDVEDFRESALCPFEVETRGFPAVTPDGRTIVGIKRGSWSASDGEDESLVVSWYDVERDTATHSATVFDGDEHRDQHADDPQRHCRPMWRAAKRKAAEINAQLAGQSWRTMVDVGIHAFDGRDGMDVEDEEAPPPSAAERPIELVHVGKQAALRIRGVRVLHRADVDWLGTESWPCQLSPVLYEVLGDRETGTLAVSLDHQSQGCLCNPEIELHTLRVPDSIFAEAAARPQPRIRSDDA